MLCRFIKTLVVTGIVLAASLGNAHAQSTVKFEGTSRFSIRYRGNSATTTGSAQRLANYTFNEFNGVRSVIVLSKKPYRAGSSVAGFTIASANLGAFPARSYFENITMNGASGLPKGSHRILLLAVDGAGNILDGLTFPKKVSFSNPLNMPRRLAFSHAEGVEVR